jgi:DNA (cytosine-5)-methyltransferase 1
MKYLSLCSGIEAATVAWHPLGWEAVAYSEIEKFPSQVLAHHYPQTPNLGDMTKFKEWSIESNVDLLVGGTPCQSFSVAGLRKGLDDPRGNLMLTYLAIADKYRPRWLVWENVPGVLSSNGGKDFGVFLGALGELGYGFAYRVLDAQYFGVAQRRRRVFVVGYLGDWRAAAAVLFERHSLSGDSPPSRKKKQKIAGYVESSFGQYREDNIGGTTKASGGVLGGGSETFITQPIALAENTIGRKPENGGENVMVQQMAVRRLTPVECERLQGFPDSYTDIKSKGKATPDGPRYKALGNSMAVPVMAWIGQRIQEVEAICKQNK